MKNVPLILSAIAGGLSVINLIWPSQTGVLISVSVLLLSVAVAVATHS